MTTLIHRAQGPDKKAAEMSDSDDTGRPSRVSQEPAGKSPNPADSKQRAWVPGTAALLTTLIGLSDILNILRPDLVNRLQSGDAAEGVCIHCNRCMPTIYSGTRCPVVTPDPIRL